MDADNQTQTGQSDQQTDTQTQDTQTQTQTAPAFTWKDKLNPDLRNAPGMDRFDDSLDGLNKQLNSHFELQKLLGRDKTVIPKGPDDKEGWAAFSKALGIPDKATDYGLGDPQMPDSMKGVTFDKNRFAEIVHAHKLTPNQAKGLWKAYTDMAMESYNKLVQQREQEMTQVINQMRGEWGDAYETNVDLGQSVINKFAGDQETMDFLTATLVKDPRGIKFLAKIGNEFAENKIGEFSMKRFSLSPEEAQKEIDAIKQDPKHAYNNPQASEDEHRRAVDYVNSLIAKTMQKQ